MTVPVNLDMDVLRTFATGMALGSFAKAGERLGRSPSAISLQLRKLEEQVGQALLRKQGRGLVLTEAGELLLGYARRMLDLNDETCLALKGHGLLDGWVRLGVPQDFAETWLPDLLARFQRAHPGTRVEARVDRGSRLVEDVQAGVLDLALTWGRLGDVEGEVLGNPAMVWIGPQDYRLTPQAVLPLVAFDAPCAFRSEMVARLDASGTQWRQVFASPSLSGLWAAVTAGLGITARIAEGKPAHLAVLKPEEAGLPALGTIDLVMHVSPIASSGPAGVLRAMMSEAVALRGAAA